MESRNQRPSSRRTIIAFAIAPFWTPLLVGSYCAGIDLQVGAQVYLAMLDAQLAARSKWLVSYAGTLVLGFAIVPHSAPATHNKLYNCSYHWVHSGHSYMVGIFGCSALPTKGSATWDDTSVLCSSLARMEWGHYWYPYG